ncbi:MAG: DUF4962 domain-containing protein [Ignavibacteria bacterium]|nr:DUF4962 domain-containing protein [Ignavibacteria bacterium]
MKRGIFYHIIIMLTLVLSSVIFSQSLNKNITLDETPASGSEWGFHPEAGFNSQVNPPAFNWRPQAGIKTWELECASGNNMNLIYYNISGLEMNVHCPSRIFSPGMFSWRYRGVDSIGNKTNWSKERTFTIAGNAVEMPLPMRAELMSRIPKSHPRLFMRPEELNDLRQEAKGKFKDRYEKLIERCEELLKNPPSTVEPLKFPATMVRYSYDWVIQWWGNRLYVIKALDAAATLAFTHLLGGKEEYGQLAKKMLLDCAKWDPKGASGYRYNDEAGMPYTHYFSRAYTFSYDLLSEEEREVCRNVAQIRGKEMYEHLYPRLLWNAYASHNLRAWHFLGEMAIAFFGEIKGPEDWLWSAMNMTYTEYPVWSDDEGGWHEGFSYWHSYLGRFNFWVYAVRSAFDIDIFKKPYFANAAGYYAMYTMPPGRKAAEFGDGSVREKGTNIVPLFGDGEFLTAQAGNAVPYMSRLAAESGNGYWQWYVDQMGGSVEETGYLGFTHPLPEKPKPIAPTDLPTSRLFKGIGVAALNSNLTNANDDVQILFKASQMGTQSHGNESNNTFVLWAYGERLLIRTGHYYMWGGTHHANWVWDTKSQNNITVDGKGQVRQSPLSKGKITAFKTTPKIDIVIGEAGEAYRIEKDSVEQNLLNRFTRAVLFVKPELIIVFDRLEAKEPSTFEYRLHALNKFELEDQQKIMVQSGDVVCDINMLTPNSLIINQTDQYNPNPWEQIKVREWHLTAATDVKRNNAEFVTLYRPHKKEQSVPTKAELKKVEGGYVLTADVTEGKIVALLPTSDSHILKADGLESTGEIVIQLRGKNGGVIETVKVDNTLQGKER